MEQNLMELIELARSYKPGKTRFDKVRESFEKEKIPTRQAFIFNLILLGIDELDALSSIPDNDIQVLESLGYLVLLRKEAGRLFLKENIADFCNRPMNEIVEKDENLEKLMEYGLDNLDGLCTATPLRTHSCNSESCCKNKTINK
jgi:hypothetical protein